MSVSIILWPFTVDYCRREQEAFTNKQIRKTEHVPRQVIADRQRDGQRDGQTDTQKQASKTEQAPRQVIADRQMDGQTDGQTDAQTDRSRLVKLSKFFANLQTNRPTNKQTDRQTDGQRQICKIDYTLNSLTKHRRTHVLEYHSTHPYSPHVRVGPGERGRGTNNNIFYQKKNSRNKTFYKMWNLQGGAAMW